MNGSGEKSFEGVFADALEEHKKKTGNSDGRRGVPPLEQGTVVDGRFELLQPLRRRGFGEIWKARIIGNEYCEAALTFVPIAPDGWNFLRESKRVQRILQSVRVLKHRNIQSVYRLKHSEIFGPYLVSQWIEGVPLDEFAGDPVNMTRKNGLIPRNIVFRILSSAAEALDYAHERGVVHCGVSPRNIFVRRTGDGYEAVLSGFGIAAIITEVRKRGAAAMSGCTFQTPPEYMSPEQWRGKLRSLDGRTDQYSLGVIAYELFSGDPPFGLPAFLERSPENYMKYLRQDVLFRNPEVPDCIDSEFFYWSLERALYKNREDRYSNCREFVKEIAPYCREDNRTEK